MEERRDPATFRVQYTEEELAFLKGIDDYKRRNKRPFPTWSEVLAVARALGWRRVAEPAEMPVFKRGKAPLQEGDTDTGGGQP